MVFNSLTFILFFLLVLLGFYFLRRWSHKKIWLLLASYTFYGAWNPPFVSLLGFSTFVDWIVAARMDRSIHPTHRRIWLVVSLVSNLGLLGYFKYGGFLLRNFIDLANCLGFEFTPATADIILPVGISFYTFQSLSYTLDIYRKKLAPSRSITDFALFVSFFPQLVAGPNCSRR